jgi:PIN domain nuclease of toxin-antitoxin system
VKLLLDTHVFMWWDSEPVKLSPRALELFQDKASTILLSVASIWEIQVKAQLGKLKLRMPLMDVIDLQQDVNKFEVLSIELAHVLALDKLPLHHKDPFDRLLIAQAMVEDAALITADPVLKRYPVKIEW